MATSMLRIRSALPVIAAALVLGASWPTLAQPASPDGGATPPAREGNIYDHVAHQPTEAEIDAAGIPPLSSASTAAVERGVAALLRQTDEQDKLAEEFLTPPAREGNVYDHVAHQPTEAEIDAAGIPPSSSASTAAVERGVAALLKQTDEQDKLAEEFLHEH